ncbi:hypothetical protein AGRA3207_005005 [Actinomadura graeca]|uniref:Uncharacterized protein n=1 Tax=Actinomadura graeca TaxID=2750812 RepID=A0ABX8QY75_9ACTN|nr:hypothetical protein [Actinomadura graeca]QXJ23800.1 hypothetical protein AGRA3207_005005 [Actinomadura graeca]
MPRHNASPSDDDVRLVEALRAGRPGAGGHVQSVYGPELTEYAEVLLGDHDRAVAAVRSALLILRDRPELAPSPETFRDRLYMLVRYQCRKAQRRGRGRLVIAGAAAGIALTTAMLLLFEVSRGESVSAPPMALTPPPLTEFPTPPPSDTPSPDPTEWKDRATTPPPSHTRPPGKRRKPADVHGRLAVHDGNCRVFHAIALPITCHVTLTAEAGPVDWSVSEVHAANGRIYTGGGGSLKPGESVAVPVRVRPTALCNLGGGVSGTVSFAPGGTATVLYSCLSL